MTTSQPQLRKEDIKIPVKRKTSTFAAPVRYKVLRDEIINLTKDKAFEFLEAKSFEGERPVRETHVNHLYDEFVGGRFIWHHVILSLAVLDREVYRMNGQHTCWMRVNIPPDQSPGRCEVRSITYRVETSEDLRALYSAFDRNAPRTVGHISRVMLMDTAAGESIPPSSIGKLCAGFKVFFSPAYKNQDRAMPVDDVVGLIKQNYPQLFNLVGRFNQIHQQEARWSGRAAVVGAQFATFEKNVKESDTFWSAVLSGVGLESKSDARWQLREWLNTHSQSVFLAGNKKTNPEETYRVCLHLWNRWRAGEEVQLVITPSTRPKVKA